jgi:diguanylate cyclase (GGDEF)-like protein
MMNWSELPDLVAIALLICAFASVTRGKYTLVSGLWLIGWLLIALHFVAFLFLRLQDFRGLLAAIVGTVAIVSAGEIFKTSIIPFRKVPSSRWMTALLLVLNALYLTLLMCGRSPAWALDATAALFGLGPLAIALVALRKVNYALRWSTVIQNIALAVFLLAVQHRPGYGVNLALNAVLFAAYLGCSINFLFAYWRATAGAFITIAGFVTWALVFALGPWLYFCHPLVHVEAEVWNLPKYIVAVGMILLLLEDQIEHNKRLALHDELTGLPNRRLFQDRLASALDRARRTGAQTALLVIDLNRFKLVNDTYGHHVGDLLLQSVGAAIAGRIRRYDTVARTGGDEFSVILEEPASREDALRVAHVLLELLNEPVQLQGHTMRRSASIGVAVFPDDAADMEALCIAADQRMYNDKRQVSAIQTAVTAD